MQIKYLINSITLVESFNHNFAFCSIVSVTTFKLTCLTVSQQNYDAVKERRNTLLHALFILPFLILFPILISLSHLQSRHQYSNFQNRFSLANLLRRPWPLQLSINWFVQLNTTEFCWTGQLSAKRAPGPQTASFLPCRCLNEGLRKGLLHVQMK